MGVSWNNQDLQACKQACLILYNMGVSEEKLFSLDFGNLDVADVITEEVNRLYKERFESLKNSVNFDRRRDYNWSLNGDLAILPLNGMTLDYLIDWIVPFIPECCAYFEHNNLVVNLNYYN